MFGTPCTDDKPNLCQRRYPGAMPLPVPDLAGLRALVAQGEGATLEFKRKVAHPRKVAREAVAFANASGGLLLIGVEDSGAIPGLAEPDGDEYLLDRALDLLCSPALGYRRHRLKVGPDAWVLIYTIPEAAQKPVALTEQDGQAHVYYRVADRSVQASRELRQLLRAGKKTRQYQFEFGAKEKLLLTHLEAHGGITLAQFATLADIPARQASRTLVLLCLAGILHLEPHDGQDVYRVVNNE